MSESGEKSFLVPTGGKVDPMCMALAKAVYDKETGVRRTIINSLTELGRKQPNLLLSTCLEYLMKNQKCPREHRIVLLKIVIKVLSMRRDQVTKSLSLDLIQLAVKEMTASSDVIPDWQGVASELLVALGHHYPKEVFQELFSRFQPTSIPHYFIIKSLGDFATSNPMDVVPELKGVLARTLPILSSIKRDNLRWVIGYALTHFCEAITSYMANLDGVAEDPHNITFATFSSEIFPAYEVMVTNWILSKDERVRLITAHCMGNMCAVMDIEQFQKEVHRLVPAMLQLYRKEKDHLPVTQALSNILEVAAAATQAGIEEDAADPEAPMRVPFMQPLLTPILETIHPLTVRPPDPNDANSIKNNNELLRCFEIIGRVFSGPLIAFLLDRLDITRQKSATVRSGTLLIIRHIANRISSGPLDDKKGLLVSGMKPLVLHESDLKCRHSLSQVVIAMGSHDYLKEEGGEDLVQFIVRQCAVSDEHCKKADAARSTPPGPEDVTVGQLRKMCDNILYLLAETVPCMEQVLWPFLFESLVPAKYTEALGVVCKSIAYLGNKKREEWNHGTEPTEEDGSPVPYAYIVDFERAVNLPKPHDIVARLFVMLNDPHHREFGLHMLNALRAIGPIIHPDIAIMWDHALPKLVQFMEAKKGDAWNSQTWEDLVLRLLAETIKLVADDEWTMKLGESYSTQIDLYRKNSELKRCSLKHLGLILQKLQHKAFINEKLDLMFKCIEPHQDDVQRQGCAQGFGYCAATHLDASLERLQDLLRPKMPPAKPKESGGFFSKLFGGSDKPKGPTEDERKTAVLALGYITAYAPAKLITSRIEVSIMSTLNPMLENATSVSLRETLVKAIDLIGKTVHPNHLKLGKGYVFSQRDALLSCLIRYMDPSAGSGKKLSSAAHSGLRQLRILALNACSTLVQLEPSLPEELESQLVKTTVEFFAIQPLLPPDDAKKKKYSPEKLAALEEAIAAQRTLFENFNQLLATILAMNSSMECLSRLFKMILPWIKSPRAHERARAVASFLALLRRYVEYKSTETEQKVDSHFFELGHTLALLVPRCTDPSPGIRLAAVESIQTVLYVDYFLRNAPDERPTSDSQAHEGYEDGGEEGQAVPVTKTPTYDMQPPRQLYPLTEMRPRISAAELQTQFGAVNTLAGVLCEMLVDQELPVFLLELIDGLTDVELTSASGTCIALVAVLRLKGAQLLESVPELITKLLEAMKGIKEEKTMNGTLHAVRTLAIHHCLPVLNELLKTAVPHSEHVVKSLQVVAKTESLVVGVIDHLCDILNNSQVIIETGETSVKPSHEGMSATCALTEILQEQSLAAVVTDKYAQLCGTVLLRLGTTSGMGVSQPREQAEQLLRAFIALAQDELIESDLARDSENPDAEVVDESDKGKKKKKGSSAVRTYWSLLKKEETYGRAVSCIAAAVAQAHNEELLQIYQFLLPYLKGNFAGQRLVTALSFAEFMNHVHADSELLQHLLNALLTCLVDAQLKMAALRGLGNIASNGADPVNQFAPTVVDALTSHIEDADESIALESMCGLSKVFELVHDHHVGPILINIIHRIRPAFEKPNPELRAASMELFGTMARFGAGGARDVFFEQICTSLPALVMHLNDESAAVQKACKRAFRRLGPLMQGEDLEALFASPQFDDDAHLMYIDVLEAIALAIVKYYPNRINYFVMTTLEFFKSKWHVLRANAATFVGFMLGNLPPSDYRRPINMGIVSTALINLLKQPKPEVRKAAASAMSLLYDY
eukprot:CAMPEP_0177640424 /NCGR_PEP_ID=MMETSP0447-20121125/6535_1 /TAXON_ID=0 /ORGANISM="Stygamoeba regulata, Strain BSH-02190019" /LENGTH=1747 /DNA_ID=CAMNT_0019142493 /DNA_START=242 /DNA_END=5485 /DNA_ORIENTATION=-